MKMAKRYIRINWQNRPSVATPISATNLNKMDKGIDDIDNAIEEIYNKRVNNVVTTNPDTFLAGPVGKTLQDQITTLNNKFASLVNKITYIGCGESVEIDITGTRGGVLFIVPGVEMDKTLGLYLINNWSQELNGVVNAVSANNLLDVVATYNKITITNNHKAWFKAVYFYG